MTLFTSFVMAIALVGVGLGLRQEGRRRRRAAIVATFPESERARHARDVPTAVLLHRTGVVRGMNPLRDNRTVSDVLVGSDRLLVVSDQGTLVDVRRGDAGLTAARATAPMRLVLEGEVARIDGPPGLFRIDLTLTAAAEWAAALAPFVRGA